MSNIKPNQHVELIRLVTASWIRPAKREREGEKQAVEDEIDEEKNEKTERKWDPREQFPEEGRSKTFVKKPD